MSMHAQHGEKWSREEHLLAFNLYLQLPFGQLHHRNPQIIAMSSLLGRTPSSLAMKLSNFARIDPALRQRGISGLSRGAKGEAEAWREFEYDPEELSFESERILAGRLGRSVEKFAKVETVDLPAAGAERDAIVRVRVNQSLFRHRIISGYNNTCCFTGFMIPELLVASHIIPWATSREHRLNPRNGLCLNALHDRAFDRGLMWIAEDLSIQFSERVHRSEDPATSWMAQFHGTKLKISGKLTPDAVLLGRHRENQGR